MRNGDIGSEVSRLQLLLRAAGFRIAMDGWFGAETEQALIAFQHRAGLVADGIAGPKTMRTLETRDRDKRHLSEADLQQAADRLGIPLAAIKAINFVESRGRGFLDDGRPIILYERHVAWQLIGDSRLTDAERTALVDRYPALINPMRGGYIGGTGEWSRLTSASQIVDRCIAQAACSWGQFQVMGYHWQRLGYSSLDAFTLAMHAGEAEQLDAFTRFIEADPALLKAIRGRKWAEVARRYNGPDYKRNSYDLKLARAWERYADASEK